MRRRLTRRWTLHDGDLVIFLEKYDRDKDKSRLPKDKRQRKVDNGETGVIVGIDTEHNRVVIEMARGDIVTVDLDDEARTQPLGLRYAVHIAKYQGHETDVGIVLPGAGRITSQNSAYAQMTRPKHEAHVIVDYETHGPDPIDRLADAWSQPETKQTAMSQLDRDDAERYRRAYDAARTTSRWWKKRRETARRDDRDATAPLPDPYDPMAEAHEDLDAVIAKHRATSNAAKPDDDEDDAPAEAGAADEPGRDDGPSDSGSWVHDPMRTAHEELDAVIASLRSSETAGHTADDDGDAMSDDGRDERTGATPSSESDLSPDALARAAEEDAKRQRAQAERTAESVPDDTTTRRAGPRTRAAARAGAGA